MTLKCLTVAAPAVFANWASKCIVMLWCHSLLFLSPFLSCLPPSLAPPSPPHTPFIGANEPSESQGRAGFQQRRWGDGERWGLSGITSNKGPPHTVVSWDNGVGEPLVGRSSPSSPTQWPLNQWACSRCGHCSLQAEPHSGEKGRGGKSFWMEWFCSNDLGRTSRSGTKEGTFCSLVIQPLGSH